MILNSTFIITYIQEYEPHSSENIDILALDENESSHVEIVHEALISRSPTAIRNSLQLLYPSDVLA